jgi:ATP phosphoribosyltransferase
VLTIAIPKGRIFGEILDLFLLANIPIPEQFGVVSRKLTVDLPEAGLSFFFAKPMDVPTYVEYGAADVGVVGKDVLLEVERDVYELLDLNLSPYRLSIAALPDWQSPPYPRVATKYPNIVDRFWRSSLFDRHFSIG